MFKYFLRFAEDAEIDYIINRLDFCFAAIQSDLNQAFIKSFVPENLPNLDVVNFFDYSESAVDSFTSVLKGILPFIIIFSAFFSANKIIKVKLITQLKLLIKSLSNS